MLVGRKDMRWLSSKTHQVTRSECCQRRQTSSSEKWKFLGPWWRQECRLAVARGRRVGGCWQNRKQVDLLQRNQYRPYGRRWRIDLYTKGEGGRVGALIDKMSGGWPRQLRLGRRRSEMQRARSGELSGNCLLARCKVSRGESGMEGSERGDSGL